MKSKLYQILLVCGLIPVLLAADDLKTEITPAETAKIKTAAPKASDGQNGKKSAADTEKAKKARFDFLKMNEKPRIGSKPEMISQEIVMPEKTSAPASGIAEKVQKIPGQAVEPKQPKPSQRLHFYDDFIMVNGDEEITVNLVFNSAPLLDVIPAFADALGFSFLADSNIKSVVTLNIDQKMPRRDLWNTFDRMLNLAGAGVMVDGSLLRIVALDKFSRQPDSRLSSKADGELFYYALRNSTAKEVVSQIKNFVGSSAVVVELTKPNAVLVADDRANMPKIKQLLETIDRSGKASWKRKIIECRNILPTKLVDELQTVLPVLGFNVFLKTDRTEQPGSIQLTGIDRLQLLIVSAATDEAVQEICQWVLLLDSSDSLDQERVFVYKVRHGKAQQLAQALSVIFDIQGSSLNIDSTTGNSKLENLASTATNRNRTQQNQQTNRNNTAVTNSTNTQTDKSSNIFETPVRIFADGVLNRLIVRTTPRTYASIKALMNRLDVVPAQVLLQVLVVEVTLTDSTKFGLEFSTENQVGGNNSLFGSNFTNLSPGTTAMGQGAVEGKTMTEKGYTWLISDPNNPSNTFGYVRALAGNNQVKVVSSPQLVVTSHTEAKIQVGQEVPYLSQGISNTQSEGSVLKNYQYKDTGVILTITPQITSNDFIALKVEQVLSSARTTTTSSTVSESTEDPIPTFDKRTVKTSMTIANGKTMVIGGLIQEEIEDDLESLPIVNQIPVLNRLLGSTNASVKRSEILVMITGYIINEQCPVESLIERYNTAINALNDFHKNLGNAPESPRKEDRQTTFQWFEDLFKPSRPEIIK